MIVFSGKQIIAHWNEGGSDFLLVAFNQLNHAYSESEHYFLRPQVEAANLSCIGVMTTEKSFYLSPEMQEIGRLVAEKRAGRPVVVFGQSMGGYAALKFSRLLGADCVLAFSPYYSVHADDLELPSDRHRRILMRSLAGHGVVDRPEFVGMAITPQDVSGRLVVLYDPAEMIDAYGASLLQKRVPQAELITIPHAGHVIYDPSWSGALVAELLEAVRSPDPRQMTTAVNVVRRTRTTFLVRTLSKAANRKPALCVAAMNAPRIKRHPDYRGLIGDPLNLRAIYLLSERGDHGRAVAHLATVMDNYYGLAIRPVRRDGSRSTIDLVREYRCLVLSVHGTFLCWNSEYETARFDPHPFGKTGMPIVATIRNGVARFAAVSDGVEKPVALGSAGTGADGDAPACEIVAIDERLIAIRCGDQYAGASPDGALYMLPGIAHQQRLVALPLQDNSKLFEAQRASWLDQKLQNVTDIRPSGPEAAQVVQRATQRWRRLFKRG